MKKITWLVSVLLLVVVTAFAARRPLSLFLLSERNVRTNLLRQTPLGSPLDNVWRAIQQEGANKNLIKAVVLANPRGYPPSEVQGDSFIASRIASANLLLLKKDREAFFIFREGLLVDIQVRTVTDSL